MSKYNIGDILQLNKDYKIGLDLYPKGFYGKVLSISYFSMDNYGMKMANGEVIEWSENLLEPWDGTTGEGYSDTL